jgi:hypothetical protein
LSAETLSDDTRAKLGAALRQHLPDGKAVLLVPLKDGITVVGIGLPADLAQAVILAAADARPSNVRTEIAQ